MNPCTQMAISFSTEMNIESKNCNITIFIYSKIEKKKFNTNVLLSVFFNPNYEKNKMSNSFLIVFIFTFVNWLMVNYY